ncbi:hypothetical protein PGTUg99_002732 [Puccinia graminis f. sp. tritici]|uniref:Uncharacterized protein n=1 Tax=Puccinia graminis f. sp. tritici TaxID=56615 RepID=A0A5B0QKF2_PUCGR|nr:hypothetical protein PGTUg99_002732 [Puccinia graminis f. sp. tritici]
MTSTLFNCWKTDSKINTSRFISSCRINQTTNFLLPDQSLLNHNQKIPSSNQPINPQVFNLIRMARIHNKRNHNKSRRLAKTSTSTTNP